MDISIFLSNMAMGSIIIICISALVLANMRHIEHTIIPVHVKNIPDPPAGLGVSLTRTDSCLRFKKCGCGSIKFILLI